VGIRLSRIRRRGVNAEDVYFARDEHLQLAILEPFGVESTYLDWRYHNLSGLHVSSTWIWRLALEPPGGCYRTMATNSRPQTIRGSLQNKSHGVRSFII
jgi:hypothetical protein